MTDGTKVNLMSNTVMYFYNRGDFDSGEVNLKAFIDTGTQWGHSMPKDGRVVYFHMISRGGTPGTGNNTMKININNNNGGVGGVDHFAIDFEYDGGSQNNTAVSGAAKIRINAGGYNDTIFNGGCPINLRFQAGQEIRIQRDNGGGDSPSDYNKVTGYLFVEFD